MSGPSIFQISRFQPLDLIRSPRFSSRGPAVLRGRYSGGKNAVIWLIGLLGPAPWAATRSRLPFPTLLGSPTSLSFLRHGCWANPSAPQPSRHRRPFGSPSPRCAVGSEARHGPFFSMATPPDPRRRSHAVRGGASGRGRPLLPPSACFFSGRHGDRQGIPLPGSRTWCWR